MIDKDNRTDKWDDLVALLSQHPDKITVDGD